MIFDRSNSIKPLLVLILLQFSWDFSNAQNGCVVIDTFQKISDTQGTFTANFTADARIGTGIESIRDLDGDGVEDIIVSAVGDDQSGSNAGALFVLLLNSNGTVKANQKITENVGGFTNTLDANDGFGARLAYLGDINGDGKVEIAVTASNDDDAGTNRGAIYILSLNNNGTVASTKKIYEGVAGFTGATTNSFGSDVSIIGDVNNDGIDDIVVGEIGINDGGANRGGCWVLFLNDSLEVSGYQKISSTTGGLGTNVLSNTDRFGRALAALGDINGDGVEDFAISADLDDDAALNSGAVYLLFLDTNGTVNGHQKITGLTPGINQTIGAGAIFGRSISNVGDVDGDGNTDILVGATGFFNSPTFSQGKAYLIYLNSNGTPKASTVIESNTSGFNTTIGAGDAFGYGVSGVGDLNNDGIADIAIGAHHDDDGGANHGAVYIMFMDDTCCPVRAHIAQNDTTLAEGAILGFNETTNTATNYQWRLNSVLVSTTSSVNITFPDTGKHWVSVIAFDTLNNCQRADSVLITVQESTPCVHIDTFQKISDTQGNFTAFFYNSMRFGATMEELRDLDGDGVDDLVVTAADDDQSGNNSGAVFILFMNSNGTVKSHQKITGGVGGFTATITANDAFGRGLAYLGDIDNDGKPELAVTAGLDDDGGTDKGAIYILTLNSNGTVAEHTKIYPGGGGFLATVPSSRWANEISIIGDVNNDGIVDIAVSERLSNDGGTDRGAFWVLFLDSSKQVSGYQKISSTIGGLPANTIGNNDNFGWGLANIGDADNDGIPDIAVGAPGDDDGGMNHGAFYYVYLNSNGTAKAVSKFSQTQGGNSIPFANNSNIGRMINSIGDIDGNGAIDILAGATGNYGNLGPSSEGEVYLFYMRQNNTVKHTLKIKEGTAGFSGTTNASDRFGAGVSAIGDINNDGITDIAIGVLNDDDGGSNKGAVYVMFLEDSCCPVRARIAERDTSIAAGISLTFNEITATGNIYNWFLNGQNVGSSPSTTITFNNAGQFWVTARVAGSTANCSRMDSVLIRVTSCTNTPNYTVSDSIICTGGNAVYTNTTPMGPSGVSYWYVNGVLSDSGTVFNHSETVAGNYQVVLEVIDTCTGSDTFNVQFFDSPTISSATVVNVTCNGGANGSITPITTGGSGPLTYNWSNGSSATATNSLAAGSYSLILSDSLACTDTANYSITEPNALQLVVVATDISCNSFTDGKIISTVAGGTLPYTYAWSNGGTLDSITGLSAGSYTLQVTDANGCTTSQSAIISQPTALSAIISGGTNVNCFGDSTGSATSIGAGGTPSYTFAWSNGQSTSSISGLSAGNYTLTVTDVNGCKAFVQNTVTQPTQAITTIDSIKNVVCNGFADGYFAASTAGGASPYTYAWSNGLSGNAGVNLSAGNYIVTITDGNNCQDTIQFSIQQLTPVIASASIVNNNSCNGVSDGAATIAATGGAGNNYTFNWSNALSTDTIQNLSAGKYYVTVTEQNSCTAMDSLEIIEPLSIAITLNSTNVACNGAATASIASTIANGTAPYTYAWNTGSSAPALAGLTASTYSLSITDANGCTQIDSIEITEPAALSLALAGTNVLCGGDSTGAVASTIAGGVMPYTFNWNSGDTTANLNGKPASNYILTVSDSNGCSLVDTMQITQPTAIVYFFNATNVSCFGGQDGSASVTGAGGTGSFTYAWSNGVTTSNNFNLFAGSYSFTVSDGNGCSVLDSATVLQPAQIQITDVVTNALCQGTATGSVQLTATGGTTPYTFSWSNGSTANNITNLTAGQYTVTLTDANGCSRINSHLINNTSINPSPNLGADVTTCGNSTVLSAGNFATYSWNTGASTNSLTVLASGTYSITVTNAAGCNNADTINVTLFPAVSAAVTTNPDSCAANKGEVLSTVTGGTTPITYVWSNGSAGSNLTGVGAGQYNLTVIDANGCQTNASGTVANAAGPNISASISDVTCHSGTDGSIAITSTGGTAPVSYTWNTGSTSQSQNNLVAGTYSISATDAFGCQANSTFIVSQPVAFNITTSSLNATCGNSDGAVSINVQGGTSPYTYLWDDPTSQTSATATGLAAGIYNALITDASGCTVTQAASVSDIGGPVISVSAINTNCENPPTGFGSVTVLSGTSPYTYAWNDLNFQTTAIATNLAVGAYFINVIDSFGCASVGSINISAINPSPAFAINGADTSCGPAQLAGPAGMASYQWSTGQTAATIITGTSGTYRLTVTNANGCSASNGKSIVIDNDGQIALGNDTILCSNISPNFTLDAGPGYTAYQWSSGETSRSILAGATGQYSVVAQEASGCIWSDTINVTFDICAMAEGVSIQELISVYPNPMDEAFYIQLPKMIGNNISIDVYSIDGKLMHQRVAINQQSVEVTTSDWASGVYLLKVRTGAGQANYQIIKN